MITRLPEPDDLTSLLVRTDYSDDAAWQAAVTAAVAPAQDPLTGDFFEACFTLVEDPSLDGVGVEYLIALVRGETLTHHLFVADSVTMRDPEQSLLVVDLDADGPQVGRTFRVLPPATWAVQNSLSQYNLEFEAFADPADAAGGLLRHLRDL